MSCSSPFVYQEGTIITNNYNIGCSGQYTLNSYTVKWGGGSWCIGCAATNCNSCGWRGWGTCCSTKWNNCCWGIEYPSWSVNLWPTISFNSSVIIPFEFQSEAGVEITLDQPESPYQAEIITLKECDLTLKIDGTNITIPLIVTEIELEEENGEFSLSIPLGGFENSVDEDGLKYTLTVETSLQFCLDPVPPVGWINLVLNCELSVSDSIDGLSFGYKTSFTISCPIVSVEDVDE